MSVNIIFATDNKGAIAYQGDLPWKDDPDTKWDMQHFRKTTLNHPVIMGYVTMKTLGRPLKDRINIVISLYPINEEGFIDFKDAGEYNDRYFYVVSSLEEALEIKRYDEEVYIIGGAYTYLEAINKDLVDTAIITFFNKEYPADIFFPLELLKEKYEVKKEDIYPLGKIVTYQKIKEKAE